MTSASPSTTELCRNWPGEKHWLASSLFTDQWKIVTSARVNSLNSLSGWNPAERRLRLRHLHCWPRRKLCLLSDFCSSPHSCLPSLASELVMVSISSIIMFDLRSAVYFALFTFSHDSGGGGYRQYFVFCFANESPYPPLSPSFVHCVLAQWQTLFVQTEECERFRSHIYYLLISKSRSVCRVWCGKHLELIER